MGYTHYFYRRSVTLDPARFAQFSQDCLQVYQRAGIPLAHWNGKGTPRFSTTEVCFNGVAACGHETFRLEQRYTPAPWETLTPGKPILASCKTARKPYDVLVTACLIIAQQYFPEEIAIASDGESQDWDDARRLCQHVLGYGADFVLRPDDDCEVVTA